MNESIVPVWAAAVAYLLEENRISAHYKDIYWATRGIIRLEGDTPLQSVKTGMLTAKKKVGNSDSDGNRDNINIFESSRDADRNGVYSIFCGEESHCVDIEYLRTLSKVQKAIKLLRAFRRPHG